MRTISFLSAVRSDKTYLLALAVVTVLGALELGAIALHYVARIHGRTELVQPSVTAIPGHLPEAKTCASAIGGEPQKGISRVEVTVPASAADRLLQEATRLREHGDTPGALARLQE